MPPEGLSSPSKSKDTAGESFGLLGLYWDSGKEKGNYYILMQILDESPASRHMPMRRMLRPVQLCLQRCFTMCWNVGRLKHGMREARNLQEFKSFGFPSAKENLASQAEMSEFCTDGYTSD